MWYFVRRWEQTEQVGNGSAWPYPIRWTSSQSSVLSDPSMTQLYAKTKAGAEYNAMQQYKPSYWALRRGAEVWVWTSNGWQLWGSYFGPMFRQPTKVEQWTDMHTLGQRYARIAPAGPGRWRTVPGLWGVTAGQVWTSEYAMA